MSGYDGFEDQRIKHMEMIQAVIGRLGNDSFLVKGWAVTVAGAFFGFAVNESEWKLALASVIPTLSFWGLDTYFLKSERLFRALYDRVRAKSNDVSPFFMGATSSVFIGLLSSGSSSEKDLGSWRKTLVRPALASFYGTLLAAAVVVIIVICMD